MLVACCAAPLSVVRKTNTARRNLGESRCAAELTSAVGTNRIQADNAKQVRADGPTVHCFGQQRFCAAKFERLCLGSDGLVQSEAAALQEAHRLRLQLIHLQAARFARRHLLLSEAEPSSGGRAARGAALSDGRCRCERRDRIQERRRRNGWRKGRCARCDLCRCRLPAPKLSGLARDCRTV